MVAEDAPGTGAGGPLLRRPPNGHTPGRRHSSNNCASSITHFARIQDFQAEFRNPLPGSRPSGTSPWEPVGAVAIDWRLRDAELGRLSPPMGTFRLRLVHGCAQSRAIRVAKRQ